ncbi:hypothetical protein ACOSP7_025106 [Xanthoceras sorbifolium]|uniref:Alkyl transferase n=1 Tax=Xanthoceras sorbifolium TaxID=99658 RepID=A0ABQ8H7K2_9ROSI|nr:hypothetical protein JRO89_XS13G0102600 [Xanthoceras sorbifolium]
MLSSRVNIIIRNTIILSQVIINFCRSFSLQRVGVPPISGGKPSEEEGRRMDDDGVISVCGGSLEDFPATLQRELMPKHVAVIMDGNRRWAQQRGVPSSAGHKAGAESLRQLVELCSRWRIKVLTVFAFSFENWIRPKVEVEFMMQFLERLMKSELESFKRDNIRLSVIGDSSKLPKSLLEMIHEAEESTKQNSKLHLILAISYGGKYDIAQACKSIARQAKEGAIELEDITESLIEQELETKCTKYPCPDLLIRTSGELRVSNFLLWQLAYTEFYFEQKLWPDFGKDEFVEALTSFQQRQRRYGGLNT